ncbi:hypothetical protein CICLE_v10030623mg [Citrus x clementina]|uniref:Leucine-rich repeat-containing N-terminal plant-type domain-containing protein n=1 Tax=Citrus clementina TaxID=85681 RepID=V4TCN9_CITCL|nr:hypothetical protein CICLE_v10030623mg [Citrus x clementina]
MGNPLPFWSWKIWFSSFFFGFSLLCILVSGRCLEDQKLLLLEFKRGLSFDPQTDSTNKLLSWSSTTDCCSWDGVTCDPRTGHVISLDISSSFITGGINGSSSLFDLQRLQHLNLANNSLYSSPFPSGFDRLFSLTHLNLSYSGFSGHIPLEISSLKMLVSLDLSASPLVAPIQLRRANLEKLVKNLTNLEELYLGGIDISVADWGPILSTLFNLRILSLPDCHVAGPIHSSLSKLQLLTHLNLDGNDLSSEVPDFLTNFSSLQYLHLSSCGLYGRVPEKIFLMPSLCFLDVSGNSNLTGSLPEFPPSSQLKVIKISGTRFSGKLPDSINNLAVLEDLELSGCSFFGSIPSSFGNLTELINIDFSRNNFSGSLPSFASSNKVISLKFAHNSFTGTIPLSYGDQLISLQVLDLRNNWLQGIIPKSLYTKQSIESLLLGQNKFHGQLEKFQNASSLSLREMDFSQNKLQGLVPESIFQIKGLNVLRLSSNNFSGFITLEMFKDLRELGTLELSENNFSFNVSGSNSNMFPKIGTLKLSSCKITEFPNFLRNQTNLFHLDLSNNRIKGEIPNWTWNVGDGKLVHLNLSHNMLEAFEKPGPNLTSTFLAVLDLHSNMLQGSFPIPPASIIFLDYSENKFTTNIPYNIGNYINYAVFFSLASNNLSGGIPLSLCNAFDLQVLDLSDNHLTGSIPSCLVSSNILKVLKLRNNEFLGTVPQVIGNECSLRTLDLSQNHLAVLVLQSNNYDGSIKDTQTANAFALLQIIDISSNNFSGNLPARWFQSWRGMKKRTKESQESQILKFVYLELSNLYYQDSVTLMNKGLSMELAKILTIFTSIDVSNNQFEGEIPEMLGDFDALLVLNMSNNNFKGQIPATLGNLKELGSLDLSHNQLSGKIPEKLATLNFLSVLKLSQNLLVGEIPRGPQFATFTAASFEGNAGLCGFPLPKACQNALPPVEQTTKDKEGSDGTGMVIGITLGVVVSNEIIKKRRKVHRSISSGHALRRNL